MGVVPIVNENDTLAVSVRDPLIQNREQFSNKTTIGNQIW